MQLTITRPDDWHLHLRDGEALASVLAHTARQFGRAIVMPNLKPPVTTVEQAATYRERIVAALPAGASGTGGVRSLDLTLRIELGGSPPPPGLVLEQSFEGTGAASDAVGFVVAVLSYLAQNDLAPRD